jgi:hypothetical protein
MRKSGSDMAGSIDERLDTYRSFHMRSDSETEGDDEIRSDNEKPSELDAKLRMVDNSALSSTIQNDLSFESSTPLPTAFTRRGIEYWGNLDISLGPKELSRSLVDFAKWAFGVNGIPSLQVLAYGDFSFHGRFAWNNHILCRQTWKIPRTNKSKKDKEFPFRPLRESDIEMMELIRENMDFLEACPLDPIVMQAQY